MVAIVSGNSLGLNLSSLAVLGAGGQIGTAAQGRGGEGTYVNVSTGNLVLQNLDGLLMGVGNDVASLRTYNSQGQATFTNGDGWQHGQYRSVIDLGNGTLERTDTDGSVSTYLWDAATQRYLGNFTAGSPIDAIIENGDGSFTWTDGATGNQETYLGTGTGLIQSATDTSGHTLSFTYNAENLLTRVATSDGESVDYTYAGRNLVGLSTTLSSGQVLHQISYTYDTLDRLTSVSVNLDPASTALPGDPSYAGYATVYTYDGDSDRVSSLTQSDGSTLSFSYVLSDGTYKVASVTDGLGHETSFAYDSAARTTTVTDLLGVSSVYQYDLKGQLTQIRNGVTPGNSSGLSQVSYEYDSAGNVTATIDGTGHRVDMEYDARGNLVRRVDTEGNTRVRTYNAANQLLTDTQFSVAASGSIAAGVPETARYVYAASDPTRLRFSISGTGAVTEYRYNALGQRTNVVTYTDATFDLSGLTEAASPTSAAMETWRAAQNLAATQRVDLAYDFRGQLQSSTTYGAVDVSGAGVAATALVTQFVYSQRGALLQRVGPQAADVTQYTYDGMGRVLSVSGPSRDGSTPNLSLTSYDDANGQTTYTLANGLSTISTFDHAGRLISVTQNSGSGTALGTTSYFYDADGNLLMEQDPTGARRWMLYDADDRKVADIDATGALVEYVYNANGQVVQAIAYATSLPTDQLVDAQGQPVAVLLSQLRPVATEQDQKTWNYYDDANRLVFQVDAAGYVVRTRYDGASRVLSTTRLANPIDLELLQTFPATSEPATMEELATLLTEDPEIDRSSNAIYRADGQLLGSIDGEGYLTAYHYNAAGQLTSTIRFAEQIAGFNESGPVGIAAAIASARAGHSLAALLPAVTSGDVISRAIYNARGQQVGQIDAEGYLTETVYDDNGNVAQTIRYTSPSVITDGFTSIAAVRPDITSDEDQITTQTWDAANQLIERTNPDGTTTTFVYDSIGQLVTSTTALGNGAYRSLTQRYDVQGRLIGELSGIGSALLTGNQTQGEIDAIWVQYGIAHTYDAAGRRTSTTTPGNQTALFFYDPAGRLTHTVNALGEVAETRYNALGQVTAELRYGSRLDLSSVAAHQGGLLTPGLSTLFEGLRTSGDSVVSHAYNTTGTLAATTDAINRTVSYSYNAFREATASQRTVQSHVVENTTEFDRRGHQVSSTLDARGIGAISQRNYDAFGRLVESTDANGYISRFAYDRVGRVVTTTDPSGATNGSTYDAIGRVLTQVDALGNTTAYRYDTAARSMTVTTPDGFEVTSIQDALGHTQSIIDGNGNTTTYTYDLDGNLLSTAVGMTTYSYDADYNVITTAAPLITGQSEYDENNRLIRSLDANGKAIVYSYDRANRLLSRAVDPDGVNLVTTYGYDAKGQRISVTDPRGVVTQTGYDLAGQVFTQVVDVGGLNLTTTFGYDAAGHTLDVVSPGGTRTSYTYDGLGRRTSSHTDTDGLNLVTNYRYDVKGNLTSSVDPNGNVTRYVYDENDRLIFTVDPTGGVQRTLYDANGRVTRSTSFAERIDLTGLSDTLGITEIEARIQSVPSKDDDQFRLYDENGRLSFTVDGTGGVIAFTYDGNGNAVSTTRYENRIDISAWVPGSPPYVDPASPRQQVLTVYDALNRATFILKGDRYDSFAVVKQTYDAVGNVVERKAYADPINLENDPATEGSLWLELSEWDWPPTDSVTRNVYDAAGRLTWTANGLGDVTQFLYDADGNIVQQVRYANRVDIAQNPQPSPSSVTPSSADRVTLFAYDGANRATYTVDAMGGVTQILFDANGNAIQQTAYATRIAAPAAGISAPGVDAIQAALTASAADRVTRSVFDGADRPVYAINAAGGVTRNVYDAVGNVVARTAYAKTVDISALPVAATSADIAAVLVSDPASDRTSLAVFDAAGRAVYQVDALGYVTQTVYDGIGQITSTTGFATAVMGATAAIDAASLSALLNVNPNGDRTTSFVYDAAGNLVSTTDPLGHAEHYTYDALGNKQSFTNKNGFQWTYDHDPQGRLILETDPHGTQNQFRYDALGNLTARYEGSRGTWYEYDALGRQVETSFDSVDIYSSANADEDAGGYGGEYGGGYGGGYGGYGEYSDEGGYYGVGRHERSGSLFSRVTYNSFGDAVANRDVSGHVSFKSYDALGRLSFDVDALGYVTEYQRNSFGDVVALTRHANQTSLLDAHSPASAPSSVQVASALSLSGADRTITTEYDKLGLAVVVTQPAAWIGTGNGQGYMASAVSRTIYNAFGQPVVVSVLTDAVNNRWAITTNYYDAAGQLTATIDALGFTSTSRYDASGNLVELTEYASAVPTANPSTLVLPPADASDRTTTFVYDANDRKISETRLGVTYSTASDGSIVTGDLTTTYGYDAVGNVVRTTDPLGASTYTYYDALGRVAAIAGPARVNVLTGRTVIPLTEFERDPLGNVIGKYEYESGATTANETAYRLGPYWGFYEDSESGTLIPVSDDEFYGGRYYDGEGGMHDTGYRGGRATYNSYDRLGRLIETQDPTGVTTEMSYDAAGRLRESWKWVSSQPVIEGPTSWGILFTGFEYDALGRQTAMITPASWREDPPEFTESDDDGIPDSVTTAMVWDAFGSLIARGTFQTDAAPVYQEYFDYDAAGRLWRTNSEDGVVKVALHDLQGRQVSQITSAGSIDLSNAGSAQEVDLQGNAGLRRIDIELDLLGRAVSQTFAQRQDSVDTSAYRPVVHQTFDRWGNVLSKSDPRNSAWITQFIYNHNNQVIEQRQPDGNGAQSTESPVTQIYYDAAGRQVALRDANNNVNGQVWDAGGNLIEELHADAGVVQQSFNAFGERMTLVDAEGHKTYYQYDRMGRNTEIRSEYVGVYTTDKDLFWHGADRSIVTRSAYDQAGRKTRQTDGTGATIGYTYDLRGNVISTIDPMRFGTRKAYDIFDHLIESEDANGSIATWAYDAFGQMLAHRDIGGADYTYNYDAARQLIAQTNTRGKNISYAYDAAGQLVNQMDLALDQVSTYDYNAAGQRIREQMVQAGVTYQDQVIGYDSLGRQALVDAFNGVHVMTTFDKVGNKLRQQTTYTTQAGSGSKDLWYAYDSMNRQLLVDGAVDGNATNEANITAAQGHILAYDLNGNRIMDKTWGNRVAVQWMTLGEDGAPLPAPILKNVVVDQGVTSQWYDYDALNRLSKISVGLWAQTQVGTDEEGELIYGPTTAFGDPRAVQLDERLYDGAGRVVHSGPTGQLPANYLAALTAGNADLPGAYSTANKYDANGRLIAQFVYNDSNPATSYWTYYQQYAPGVPSRDDKPTGSGYDNAGNLLAYRVFRGEPNGTQTSETHVMQHEKYEGYVQTRTFQIDINSGTQTPIGGVTTQEYDVNGYLTGVTDLTTSSNSRTFVNDTQGQALHKVNAPAWQSNQLIVNGEVTGIYGLLPDRYFPVYPNGLPHYTPDGNFNLDYRPVTNSYPSAGAGQYTVQPGDTLRSIALNAYGDSSLWYLIANANALDSDADLRAGQTLNIPTKLSATNNANTYTPYDPARIVGSTDPQLPAPAAKNKKKCGAIGMLLVAVVAVVATAFAIGAVGGSASAAGAGTAGAGAGAGGGFMATVEAGASIMGGAGISSTSIVASSWGLGTGLLGTATTFAIGGAVGSIAGQLFGMAIGVQDKFSWSNVALGALAGGVSGLVGAATSGAGSALAAGQTGAAGVFAAVGRAALSSAATQGIAVAIGLQDHFSWSSVAASAVGAGVGAAVSNGLGSSLGNSGFGQFATRAISGFAGGVTTAALRGGRVNVTQVAADAFGNALGQSIAESSGQATGASSSTGEDQLGDLIKRNNGWAGVSALPTFAEDMMTRRATNNPYGLPTTSATQLISDEGWAPTANYGYAGLGNGITNWRNNMAASDQFAGLYNNDGRVVRDWDPDDVQERSAEPGQINRSLTQAVPFSKVNGVTYYRDANGAITDYDPTPKYVRNPVAGGNQAEVEQRIMSEAARDGAQQLAQEAQDASDRAAFAKRTSLGGAVRGLGAFVENTIKSPYHLYRSVDEVGITGTAERMAEGLLEEPSRIIDAASSGDMQTLAESAAGILLGAKGLRGSAGRESLSTLERTDQRVGIRLNEDAGSRRIGNASTRLEEGSSAERAAAAAADIPLGLRGSGTTLAANMGGLEQGFQAHHLVMSSMAKDSFALQHLAEKGLYDVNRASNGLALPSSEFLSLADELPMHLGSHGKIYKEAVSAELSALDIAYRRGASDASLVRRIGIIENNLADRLLKGEVWLNERDAALRKLGPYR